MLLHLCDNSNCVDFWGEVCATALLSHHSHPSTVVMQCEIEWTLHLCLKWKHTLVWVRSEPADGQSEGLLKQTDVQEMLTDVLKGAGTTMWNLLFLLCCSWLLYSSFFLLIRFCLIFLSFFLSFYVYRHIACMIDLLFRLELKHNNLTDGGSHTHTHTHTLLWQLSIKALTSKHNPCSWIY